MVTNSTASTFSQDDAPSKLHIEVEVLAFAFNEKLGSTLVGRAHIAIHGVIPGHVLKIRNVAYFKAFEPDNPEDFGRAKMPQCKEGDDWVSIVELESEDGKDKALHFRILVAARRATEAYLKTHDANAPYGEDSLAESPATDEEVSDKDIPF